MVYFLVMNKVTPHQQGGFKPSHTQTNPFGQSPIEMGGAQSKNTSQSPAEQPLTLGEHFDGALDFVADSLFGGSMTHGSSDDSSDNDSGSSSSNNPFAEALKREQGKNSEMSTEMKKQQHLAKHKEMQLTEVFDIEKKKSEQLIKQIKEELLALIHQMKNLGQAVDQSIHTATFQDDPNPGTYHVNFFTQLRNFLVLLTKRVREGNTWMQTFQGKKHKSKYMQNSQQYGSQYQFGQEGQGLTRQAG